MTQRVGGPQGPQGGGQQTVNIDISQAEDVTCVACGSPYFLEGTRIKRLSVFLSPTGKEEMINLQTLLCMSCGHEMGQPAPSQKPQEN